MEYTSPGEALSKGIMSGVSLVSNFQQIKQQREQAQWERQLKVAEIAMKHSENKNLKPEQRAKFFNEGVRPVFARMGIQMPEMTGQSITSDAFTDALKNSNGLIDQMQAGKIDPHVGFNAITQHFTGALQQMDAETETQKATREMTINAAKRYADEADKAKAKTVDSTPTGAEAIKRQSELQIQLANMNKQGGAEDQITAAAYKKAFGVDIDPSKITPEMREQVKGAVRKELSYLNQFVPDEYRHKEGITMAEAKALKEKGFSPERMSRDFFVTDAPGGMDPLAMAAKRPQSAPAGAPPPVAAAPVVRPVTPPPMAAPAPSAGPAPVATPAAGPLSLAGGAVAPTQAAPLRLDNRSLQ
jgi:hypothetical protein